VVCLAPRVPGEIVDPRRLSGVVVRPLNFTVRRHCMSPQHIRLIGSLAALVFILAGLYCVLWIFSSASLACTACNCTYSLFPSSFRCRQPYVAMILAAVFFGLAVWVNLYTRRLSASRSSTREASNDV
jgi:hypothetical protein